MCVAVIYYVQVACHWFDFVDPAVSLVLAVGIGLSVLPLVRRALPYATSYKSSIALHLAV